MWKPTNLKLLMFIPFSVCLGCLGLLGIVPSTSPEINTTELEKVAKEVDTYFAENKQLYANANQTIDALADAQNTFKLSSQDYQAMIDSVVDGSPYHAPNHLSPDQSTALQHTVAQASALQTALSDSVTKAKEASTFLSSKTATIESELLTLRGNYEMIQRNPLASRREKGKAANEIRKANQLGAALKQRALEQHKALLGLQKKTIAVLQNWAIDLKGMGGVETQKALSGIKQSSAASLGDNVEKLESKVTDASNKGLDNLNAPLNAASEVLDNAGSHIENTATQLDDKATNLKDKANKNSKSLKAKTDKHIETAKSSIQESATEAIESINENTEGE